MHFDHSSRFNLPAFIASFEKSRDSTQTLNILAFAAVLSTLAPMPIAVKFLAKQLALAPRNMPFLVLRSAIICRVFLSQAGALWWYIRPRANDPRPRGTNRRARHSQEMIVGFEEPWICNHVN